MATFVKHYPNAGDPTIGVASISALVGILAAQCVPAYLGVAPIGEGEQVGDYAFFSWGAVPSPAGEAPYIQFQMQAQASPFDIVQKRIHYNATLKGGADPLLFFDPSSGLFDGKPDAAHADWLQALGGNKHRDFVTNFAAVLNTADLVDGAFTNTGTLEVGTDGVRAGLPVGISHRLIFNPTAAEVTLGIQPIIGNLFYPVVFGGTDGHNILGSTSVGTNVAVEEVPQLVIQQGTSVQNWDLFTAEVTQIAAEVNTVNIFSNTTVTNSGDLGGVTPPASEPDPGDVQWEVYGNVGVLPTLIANPSTIPTLTTGGALATTFFGALATLASDLFTKGVPALLQANLPALGSLSDLGRIATALEAIQAEVTTIDNHANAVSLDLERLVNLLGSPQGEAEPPARILDALTALDSSMTAVAETRQELTLRAKGVEVEAVTGALYPAP